jgi:SAM-dependent methyltransferase
VLLSRCNAALRTNFAYAGLNLRVGNLALCIGPEEFMDSYYDDLEKMDAEVSAGRHREIIGGEWDAIGKHQYEFLVARGLKPGHRLLDLGCGSLRGGVHFVAFLDGGNYFGLDISKSLLDAGYDIEVKRLGLTHKLPRENLVCTPSFEMPLPDEYFDFILAQSVFTHISFNAIRVCLEKTARLVRRRGIFFRDLL